jgi:hypothetical protein
MLLALIGAFVQEIGFLKQVFRYFWIEINRQVLPRDTFQPGAGKPPGQNSQGN